MFYAYEDARTPFLTQIPVTVISLAAIPVILLTVDPAVGHGLPAGASSFGNLVSWLMGTWRLHRHARRLGTTPPSLAREGLVLGKLLVAGLIAWAAGTGLVALLDDLFWSHRLAAVLLGAVVGAIMTAVFAGAGWLLKSAAPHCWTRPCHRLTRRGKPVTS